MFNKIHQTAKQPAPNKLIEVTDNILLLVSGALIAGRCQINESFPLVWRLTRIPPTPDIGGAEVTSMVVFAALISTAAMIWLTARAISGTITWRKTALVLPLLVMLAAGIFSVSGASNKNTAFIAALNLLSQMVLAILLVQLLNTSWKQRLILCVVAATGISLAYRCAEQHFYDIPSTIKMFEENPQESLQVHGIEAGTYHAQQYIDRIKSRDVGGYFAISNTAASLFILSIMATLALVLDKTKCPGRHGLIIIGTLAILAQIAGLLITKSKGGIGASAAAMALLVILWSGRRFLRRHWRSTIVVTVALAILAIVAIAGHGLYYGRLPGNSMWVRWQYWHSGGAMIADHWLRGVGPENFGTYYTQYISPAAPEVVKDPHCFLMAIWCGWGLPGLFGFLWAIMAVCVHLARPRDTAYQQPATAMEQTNCRDTTHIDSADTFGKWWLWGPALVVTVISIRISVSDLSCITSDIKPSVYLVSFIVPAIVWLISFILLAKEGLCRTAAAAQRSNHPSIGSLILGCGLLGFLLHNTIDFAIFQPGLGTCFFALAATAMTLRRPDGLSLPSTQMKIGKSRLSRAIIVTTALAVVAGLWIKVVFPVSAGYRQMQQAQFRASKADELAQTTQKTQFYKTENDMREYWWLLQQAQWNAMQATAANKHDPAGPYFLARLCSLEWTNSQYQNDSRLESSIRYFHEAIRRDPANFKYYQQLSDVYNTAARHHPKNKQYLHKALTAAQEALKRYPVKSELLIDYGKLLLEMDRRDEALTAFEKALQNEQAYLNQQRQMYPQQTEPTPRLKPALQQWTEKQLQRQTKNH